jgi:methyl-accepting chemotaxis protein
MSEQKPISERISILETQVDNHATRLEENQLVSNKLIERLDAHMVASIDRDAKLQDNLIQVTIAVTHLSSTVEETNTTLKKIAGIVDEDAKVIRDWQMISKTAIKIISILVSVSIGIWVVGTFLYTHPEVLTSTSVVK